MGIPTLTMNSFKSSLTQNRPLEPASIAESILTIAGGAAYLWTGSRLAKKVLGTFSVAQYQEVVK